MRCAALANPPVEPSPVGPRDKAEGVRASAFRSGAQSAGLQVPPPSRPAEAEAPLHVLPSVASLAPAASAATTPTRRLREGPVDRDGLVHERAPVHLLDRLLGLPHRAVLNEAVALDEARAAVEVEVQVLDLPVLREGLEHVILLDLLVHIGDNDDVALDRPRGAGPLAVVVEALEDPGIP